MTYERLLQDLVSFVCERTGLDAETVNKMLDANDEFWDHHRRQMVQFLNDPDTE